MAGRGKSVDLAALNKRIEAEGGTALLTHAEAVALIVSRLPTDGRDLRALKNSVGMAIRRVGSPDGDSMAGGLAVDEAGRMTINDMARWARRRYPDGNWDGLPLLPGFTTVHMADGLRVGDQVNAETTPGDIQEAQALIHQLRRENSFLKDQAILREAERLRELAARFRKK
jgi:CubicO group peptidase (beta-lactamase class C family)